MGGIKDPRAKGLKAQRSGINISGCQRDGHVSGLGGSIKERSKET